MSVDPRESPPSDELLPEDLARMLTASTGSVPQPGGKLRRSIAIGALIAAIGLGASVMSCVGQSFSLRQARAQEGIQEQLQLLRLQLHQQGCSR